MFAACTSGVLITRTSDWQSARSALGSCGTVCVRCGEDAAFTMPVGALAVDITGRWFTAAVSVSGRLLGSGIFSGSRNKTRDAFRVLSGTNLLLSRRIIGREDCHWLLPGCD